jgi:glycosyltransferase involved in cell wall biosynthesis
VSHAAEHATQKPTDAIRRLAVVLIARNQAWNIARLVDSVLRETSAIPGTRVVLVDSASDDRTVELAAAFPIGVLQLTDDQPLTPAAGRLVGYRHTQAEMVLFLDGDMELAPEWLDHALRLMDQEPDAAVVTGRLEEAPIDASGSAHDWQRTVGPVSACEIAYAAGAGLYRRRSLEQVANFNPYLNSDEEPELCIRFRHAGERVLQLNRTIACHYSKPADAFSTLLGRWRRGLYLGAGQAIRSNVGTPVLRTYVRERGYGIVPGLALVLAALSLVVDRTRGDSRWIRLWLFGGTAVLAGDAAHKRSMRRTAYSMLHRLVILDGTVRGFVPRPREPNDYPGRVTVIKPLGEPDNASRATG